MEVSNLTKDRIKEFLNQEKRFDERSLQDFREISIETGISKNAEGSCKVKMGNTEVIAGVKVDVSEPYSDSEDEGTLIVTCELLPLSSEKFEYGPPRIEAIEIARIVDRGIRESGIIDSKKLCIKKGEKVFGVFIDIYSINDDGNLIDASCLASAMALRNAKMPKYNEKKERIEYGQSTNKQLPLNEETPLTVTFYKIGKKLVVDPTNEEEEAAEARVSVALTKSSKKKGEILINAIQKGGNKTFSQEEVKKIIELAIEKFKELEKEVESKIKEK